MREMRSNDRALTIQSRDGGGKTVVGYAAVFYSPDTPGSEFQLFHDVRERVSPGAFNRALAEKQDVRGLVNHDKNNVIGRTVAGTMRLSVDHVGLRYEIDVPDTTAGRDLVASIERGDITGSSFAFQPAPGAGQKWVRGVEYDVRLLLDVDLFDVGPVTYPAYAATSAGVRAVPDDSGSLLAEYRDWKRSTDLAARAIEVTATLAMLDAET